MPPKKYAKALLEIMMKENLTEPVREDMKNIKKITKEKTACDYLADRAVSKKDKMDVFLGCHPLTRSFLNVVMDNKREKELYEISREYMGLLNKRLNEADAEVSSRIALLPKEKNRLKEKLEKMFRKKVDITFKIDRNIIGGLNVKIGDKVIDGTINGKLAGIREALVA